MSEQTKGAASGTVQGAAAGAAVGSLFPGIGTVVGAVVGGFIGGVWGGVAGSFGDKAKKKLKQAKRIQQMREEDAYKQQYLMQLREGRLARASALSMAVQSGSELGSGVQGNLSSMGSQIANNIEYMSIDRGRELRISQLQGKAKKLAKKSSDTMGALTTTATVVGLAAGAAALASSATASAAGTAAGKVGTDAASAAGTAAGKVGTAAAAEGMTGSIATTSANTLAGTTGQTVFSQSVWEQASKQLLARAQYIGMGVSASSSIGRAIYSGTKLQ